MFDVIILRTNESAVRFFSHTENCRNLQELQEQCLSARDDIVYVRSVKHIVQCLTEFFCLLLSQGQTLEGYPFR